MYHILNEEELKATVIKNWEDWFKDAWNDLCGYQKGTWVWNTDKEQYYIVLGTNRYNLICIYYFSVLDESSNLVGMYNGACYPAFWSSDRQIKAWAMGLLIEIVREMGFELKLEFNQVILGETLDVTLYRDGKFHKKIPDIEPILALITAVKECYKTKKSEGCFKKRPYVGRSY